MAEKKEIQFAIESFEIRRFSSADPDSTVRKDRLDYQIQHVFDINTKKKIFSVGFRVKVMTSKQSSEELASIETLTSFKLKGIESEKIKEMPEQLVTTFLSISYSSTRGALAAKTQGTVVGSVPLPLINPSQIVKSMIENAINSKENNNGS